MALIKLKIKIIDLPFVLDDMRSTENKIIDIVFINDFEALITIE